MRGRYAKKLIADCLTPTVPTCEPFRACSVHIIHNTNGIYYKNRFDNWTWNNACGCFPTQYWNWPPTTTTTTFNPSPTSTTGVPTTTPAPYEEWTTVQYGSKLDFPTLRGPSGYFYGLTPRDEVKRVVEGYVKRADLEPWRQKRITSLFNPQPPGVTDAPRIFRSGPSLKNGHAVYGLTRANKQTLDFPKYLEWYFTDPHPGWEWDRGVNCCHVDWLAYTYPAKHLWSNRGIERPFHAWNYFEDSGVSNGDPVEYGLNAMEFCKPLEVYDKSGNFIGNYTGYTHMIFLNNNAYICGNDINEDNGLPYDPTGDEKNIKPTGKVYRYQDAMSIDVHYYLKAQSNGGTLKSPRIGSIRFWRPHTDFGSKSKPNGANPCNPYLYWWCGGFTNNWWINCEFNILEGGTEVIPMGLSSPHVYVVA